MFPWLNIRQFDVARAHKTGSTEWMKWKIYSHVRIKNVFYSQMRINFYSHMRINFYSHLRINIVFIFVFCHGFSQHLFRTIKTEPSGCPQIYYSWTVGYAFPCQVYRASNARHVMPFLFPVHFSLHTSHSSRSACWHDMLWNHITS